MKKTFITLLLLLASASNGYSGNAAYFFGIQEDERIVSYLRSVNGYLFPYIGASDEFSLEFDMRAPEVRAGKYGGSITYFGGLDAFLHGDYTQGESGVPDENEGRLSLPLILSLSRVDDNLWHSIVYKRESGVVTLEIDSVLQSSIESTREYGNEPYSMPKIGHSYETDSLYRGLLKNLKITVNDVVYLDMPFSEDLLDHSATANPFINEWAEAGGLVTLVDENITTYPAAPSSYEWDGETCCHIYKNDGEENWTYLTVSTGGNIIAGDLTGYGYKRLRGCALIEFETPIPKGATLNSFTIGTRGAEVAVGDWYGKISVELSNNPSLPVTAEEFSSRVKSSYVVYDSDNQWMDDFKSAIQSLLSSDDVSSLLVFFEDNEGSSATNSAYGISSIRIVYKYTENSGGSLTKVVPWRLAN